MKVERAGGRGVCSYYSTQWCELRIKVGLFPYAEHSQGPGELTAQPLSLFEATQVASSACQGKLADPRTTYSPPAMRDLRPQDSSGPCVPRRDVEG